VFAAPDDRDILLAAFLAAARRERRCVTAVQLMHEDAGQFAAHGFAVNQFGASYARSLETFALKGSKFMQLRNKISRARRAGVQIVETPDEPSAELDALDATWLAGKGRHVKELDFLIGERGGPASGHRRIFRADLDGRTVGYVSFSPVSGSRPGWLHDLTRRAPDAPPGTMELIVHTAVEQFRAEQSRPGHTAYLHFGMTPFTGLDDAHEVPGHASRGAAWVVRILAEHGKKIYPAADQVAYKLKWAPDVVLPEYVAFAGRVRAGAVWQLLRVTRAV
jgi:lysylphosphatidylglycerol synthetase-like protein (DUF2156 family)